MSNLNNICYGNTFKNLQNAIHKKTFCEIDYNPNKKSAILNMDCGSATYINFNTKQTYIIVKHWPNLGTEWLSENLAHITGPCGTGCSQSTLFVPPATVISCPFHEFRITSLSDNEPPDFYNNNPLLIEPNYGIYVCYNEGNDIQVFKLPKKLIKSIIPPKGYYSDKATIRNHQLIIFYKNATGDSKKITYGKI